MKKNDKKCLLLAAVLTGILACQLTACNGKKQEPVVAEKSNEDVGRGQNSTKTDSGQDRSSEAGSRRDSGEVGNGRGNGEAGNGIAGTEMAALIEAPDRYRTEVAGKRTRLSADAPVSVPDLVNLPVIRAKKSPYSPEEYELFKKLTADAAGIEWSQKGDWGTSCRSEDQVYSLSFVDGTEDGKLPILWMNHLFISDGSSSAFDSRNISGMDLSEAEKLRIQHEIEEKAEAFLKAMDDGDFAMYQCEWRALQERKKDSGESAANGEYGLHLRYGRLQQGVLAPGLMTALIGEAAPRTQYVEFLYSSDGTLLLVKNIGREVTVGEADSDLFLLPFAAIAQIFEQYGKTYFDSENHTPEIDSTDSLPSDTAQDDLQIAIRVDSVRLEYRYQQDAQSDSGTFVPVWNFYGSVKKDVYANTEQNRVLEESDGTEETGLLVSINAGDGTIYGN